MIGNSWAGQGIFNGKSGNEGKKRKAGTRLRFHRRESYGGRRKLPPTPKRYGGRDGGQERESGNWAEGRRTPGGVAENENVSGISAAKLDAKTALDTAGALPENVNYAVTVGRAGAAAPP